MTNCLANERRDRLLDLVLALSPRVLSVLLLHFYEGRPREPDEARLRATRAVAQSILMRRKRSTALVINDR